MRAGVGREDAEAPDRRGGRSVSALDVDLAAAEDRFAVAVLPDLGGEFVAGEDGLDEAHGDALKIFDLAVEDAVEEPRLRTWRVA